ncbi:MAG: hypothetical protein B1H03_00145 [Planctomycetales bacterium 4484_113]|nr:MAG: hypothetical protein B1H03_00145 [Planctomycetales bacterium 4484_113]
MRGRLKEKGELGFGNAHRRTRALRPITNPFSDIGDGFDCVSAYSSGCTQENPFDGTDCLDNHGYDICVCQGEAEFDAEACPQVEPGVGVICTVDFSCANFVCDEFRCVDEAFSCTEYSGACRDGDCPNGKDASFTCPHYFSCKSIGTETAY